VIDWHVPVLVDEVLGHLLWRPDGVYLDGTTGTGGHAEAILRTLPPPGRLLCIDQDPDVLAVAQARLGDHGGRVHFYRANFAELDPILSEEGIPHFDGILLDLGLNSYSLAQKDKGLSYQTDGPLSMRCDPTLPETAADILARRSEEELARIFTDFGEARRPRLYARRVVEARKLRPLDTTAALVRALLGGHPGQLTPAELSRLFGALRVAVGREMERLDEFLRRCPEWIGPSGRLAIIAYASHEDRRIKHLTSPGEGTPQPFRPLHRGAIQAGPEEIRQNVLARSAKLRCFERGGS
jgi:16S rRNA (cytosine1402-N4)-methyltransferase